MEAKPFQVKGMFTEVEYVLICAQAKAFNMSVNDYVRLRLLGQHPDEYNVQTFDESEVIAQISDDVNSLKVSKPIIERRLERLESNVLDMHRILSKLGEAFNENHDTDTDSQ